MVLYFTGDMIIKTYRIQINKLQAPRFFITKPRKHYKNFTIRAPVS